MHFLLIFLTFPYDFKFPDFSMFSRKYKPCIWKHSARGGLAIVAGGISFFLRMRGFFVFKNDWHLKDIFKEIEAFVKI
jgi:hypothetical protein